MVIFTGMTAASTTLGPAADPRKNSQTALGNAPTNPLRRVSARHEHRNLVIVKFGGSSPSKAKWISQAVEAVAREYGRGNRLVVVVRAVGKTIETGLVGELRSTSEVVL